MQKNQIRSLKSHYGDRWRNTIPSLHDRVILKMLIPGTSLGFDCVANVSIIPNLKISDNGMFNNIIAMNLPNFKYKTLDQLADIILEFQKQTLPHGRIFVSFNFQFVNFNRLKDNFYESLEIWINFLQKCNLQLVKNFTKELPKTNDWGDCFFIFENYEISNSDLLPQSRRQD
jgi:hypothetical protein